MIHKIPGRTPREISLTFPFDPGLLTDSQYIAGLTLQSFAHSLQSIECYSLRSVFLETPKRRMTDAGFFGQPIKGSLMLLQQLVDSDSNHALPGLL